MGYWHSAGLELRYSFRQVCFSNPSKINVKKKIELEISSLHKECPRLSGFSTLSEKAGLIVLN